MRILNWFNRALVVLGLLAILTGGLAVSLVPAVLAGWLRALAAVLEGAQFLALAGVGLPLALVALLVLVLELRLRRPDAVSLAGGAGAQLSIETVVQRLRTDVEAVGEVDQARPIVRPRRGGKVDVELAVTTAPAVDVPTKAAEIRAVASGTIERLGLNLGKLSVRLSHTQRAWPLGRTPARPDHQPEQPALGSASEPPAS